MPSREELLQSIQPGMRLTKAFFMRIYGYEITYQGFVTLALDRLKAIGCSKAREYYQTFTAEYEARRDAEWKEVAQWYRTECEKKWKKEEKKEGEERRKQEIITDLLQKSDSELLSLLQKLS